MNDFDMKALRILVVEDEEFMLNMTVRLLKNLGVKTISVAKNGQEALLKIQFAKEKFDLEFDVILCDLEMPILNGFGFLRRLRRDSEIPNRRVPVIILTGHSDMEHLREALDLGIHGFIVKPISGKLLEQRITTALHSPQIDPAILDEKDD